MGWMGGWGGGTSTPGPTPGQTPSGGEVPWGKILDAAVPAGTAILGMLLGGQQGGIDKATRERLLAFINANLPMFQKLLSKQFGLEDRLVPQVEQFWQQFMPTQFDNLSEFVRARRDAQLQSMRSEMDTTRQGGLRQLYQKYGNRLPASILQSFLGTVGRTGTEARTGIARESLERQFEVGKEAAQGFMGLAGRQSGFANMFQPSLGQAMGEGLRPTQSGFTADVDLNSLMQSIRDIFKKGQAPAPPGETKPNKVSGFSSIVGTQPTFGGFRVG